MTKFIIIAGVAFGDEVFGAILDANIFGIIDFIVTLALGTDSGCDTFSAFGIMADGLAS